MLQITEKKETERAEVLDLEGRIDRDCALELIIAVKRGRDSVDRIIPDFAKLNFFDEEAAPNSFKNG